MRHVNLIKATFLAVIACCIASCNSRDESNEKYFSDYSFVNGKAIKPLSGEQIKNNYKNRTYFIVKFPDSSYQEIIVRNLKLKDYVSTIKVYKRSNLVIYHILLNDPLLPEREKYMAYKDSILKMYSFGGHLGGKDKMIGTFSYYQSDSCAINRILVADTSNFINRIWDFDKGSFIYNPGHDTLKVKAKAPTTLVDWLKKHELYE